MYPKVFEEFMTFVFLKVVFWQSLSLVNLVSRRPMETYRVCLLDISSLSLKSAKSCTVSPKCLCHELHSDIRELVPIEEGKTLIVQCRSTQNFGLANRITYLV